MIKDKKLLQYFLLLIDMIDRRATYCKVISEKEKQLKTLGIENKMGMPEYPKVEYDFLYNTGRFIVKLFVFYAVLLIVTVGIQEIFSYDTDNALKYLFISCSIIIIVFFAVKEIFKKRRAKNHADTLYYDTVNTALEHNRLDDLRVWKENKQANELKNEIEEWQKKLDFVDETISKSCQYGDLPEEYCNIKTLTVFLEYIKDKRCDTIYECMMKYDEAMRMKQINNDIDALEREMDSFEEAFSEASRQVSIYLRKRKENVEELCRYQNNALDDIEYNQETTNQGLTLLSLFD